MSQMSKLIAVHVMGATHTSTHDDFKLDNLTSEEETIQSDSVGKQLMHLLILQGNIISFLFHPQWGFFSLSLS